MRRAAGAVVWVALALFLSSHLQPLNYNSRYGTPAKKLFGEVIEGLEPGR